MSNEVAPDSPLTRVRVAPQPDFLQQQARAAPLQALAECVWNGLDADATRVEIEMDRDELALRRIVVRDNGTAMSRDDASVLFSKLGDSWKKLKGRTESGRALHGSEGRGRYKVIALGRIADWRITYRKDSGELFAFTISMDRDNPTEVTVSGETLARAENVLPGVELTIGEPLADFTSLQNDEALQALAEIFATYLKNYPAVTISLQGVRIDPKSVIASTNETNLVDIIDEETVHPVRLEIVEWLRPTKRILYLCDEKGFPLLNVDTRWHVGERFFSAYLRSTYFRTMSDRNEIGLGEMNPHLAEAVEEARQKIKDHFRKRAAEAAQSVVADWKAENIYPYQETPKTPIEQVEREVFDIVAVTATRYIPDFSASVAKSRAFQLRMMRTAIENGSSDLQLILKEVLNLPARKQEELAQLLQETSLLSIIEASKVVGDRLKFLTALEAILFEEDISRVLKERKQLHRILADHTWLFGEEYHMMVDDRSLNECLKQHYKMVVGTKPPKGAVNHPDKARGIVDLMFGRQRKIYRVTDAEHLVVELKAPSVKIGAKEIAQVEGYVSAISDDGRFDKARTRWTFWVLSKEIDNRYVSLRQQSGAPDGTVINGPNVAVVVKSWGEVIADNRARMQFFQDSLQHTVSKADALTSLKKAYDKIFSETPAGSAIDEVVRATNNTIP